MGQAAAQVHARATRAILPAQPILPSRLLGSIGKVEKLPEERIAEVHESKAAAALLKSFSDFLDYGRHASHLYDIWDQREHANEVAKKLSYNSGDVYVFSVLLKGFEHDKNFQKRAGIFLSSLLNNGPYEDYTILTDHLSLPPHYLCWFNDKNVTVFGSAAENFGLDAGGGEGASKDFTMRLTGSAHFGAFERMWAGTGIIEGPSRGGAKDLDATVFFKGKITGNAGEAMRGGELHIYAGATGDVAKGIHGGKVFIDGEVFGKIGARPQDEPTGRIEIRLNPNYSYDFRECTRGRIYYGEKLLKMHWSYNVELAHGTEDLELLKKAMRKSV